MLFFGEALGMRYAIGVACIVAGLLFIHAWSAEVPFAHLLAPLASDMGGLD
jgi:drug/metabolite transporter (DMT)-like permease